MYRRMHAVRKLNALIESMSMSIRHRWAQYLLTTGFLISFSVHMCPYRSIANLRKCYYVDRAYFQLLVATKNLGCSLGVGLIAELHIQPLET
jgi:hypothetical protein